MNSSGQFKDWFFVVLLKYLLDIFCKLSETNPFSVAESRLFGAYLGQLDAQPSPSLEAVPCIHELPLLQASSVEMLPSELLSEMFSSCTTDSLRSCIQVCSLWKNIITSNYMITKLCMLAVDDEANFDRLLLVLKQNSREELKILLRRFYDEKRVSQKVLMDLIVRLFMVDDVFSIVADLLRDPSIPMFKLFQENCGPRSANDVLKDPEEAKAILNLTPELVKAVLKDLTPKNFRPWLSLPPNFRQLMDEAREENATLALRIYRQFKGAVHLPAQSFPTLSCIDPLLPLFFPLPWLVNDNGERIFVAPRLYLQLTKIQSSEEVMPKEMTDKILDILSLVEINELSLKLLVPHLCPSFLKGWKERGTKVGKPIITEFLMISQQFKKLNQGISYGKALMSTDFSVIRHAIKCLTGIDSVPFFVYRPLIVRCIDRMPPWNLYNASQVPFSGIEYPPCFMEDLYVLALAFSKKVHAFLKFLDPTQRLRLVSYSTALTSRLFAHFKEAALDCEVLSAVPSLPYALHIY